MPSLSTAAEEEEEGLSLSTSQLTNWSVKLKKGKGEEEEEERSLSVSDLAKRLALLAFAWSGRTIPLPSRTCFGAECAVTPLPEEGTEFGSQKTSSADLAVLNIGWSTL